MKEEAGFLKRVCIPYSKGLSERFARIMKRYKVDTIHKPTTTIKNMLCSTAKDKLHKMDKPGVIYSIKCHAHNSHYVGETGRAGKERLYEHRVISHLDSKRSHSLEKVEVANLEQEGDPQVRRSKRNLKRVDYKTLHNGSDQLLTTGSTVVSEHMATKDHKEGDVEIKLLDFEPNWKRRKIKEKIAINKLKPDLNGNEGYNLSAIFDPIPSKFIKVGASFEVTSSRGSPSTEELRQNSRSGADEGSCP